MRRPERTAGLGSSYDAVMGATVGSPASGTVQVGSSGRAGNTAIGVPWYIWVGVASVTSATIGGLWDYSWHRSIGRDSFWTPAHVMIYLCGVLAGIIGLDLVIRCTTGRDPQLREASVSLLGLRAPLGIFLAAWGGLAMLTAAPFDNWWHAAYGLDVELLSPPHTLLILGDRVIAVGITFLVLATMNRAARVQGAEGDALPAIAMTSEGGTAPKFRTLQWILIYLGGLAIHGQMFFLQELMQQPVLHRANTYLVIGTSLGLVFGMFWVASRHPWACTLTAGIYTLFQVGEILILPLFPAQPRLGPVLFPVTHMMPGDFPILILAPAIALDLLWQRTRDWKAWKIALVSGVVFIAVLMAVEWPFADFLMSPLSQNRFFGTMYFGFGTAPDSAGKLHIFVRPEYGMKLAVRTVRAMLFSSFSIWIGLRFGRWMRGLQR